MGGLQRSAADRLLRHGVHRRPAGADHRAGHVTGAVGAVQARQQGLQHPDRALAALPGPGLVPGASSSCTSHFVFTTGAAVNLNHLYAGRTDGSWIGFAVFAAIDGRRGRGWVGATPFTLPATPASSTCRPGRRRTRSSTSSSTSTRSPATTPRPTSPRTSGTTASTPTPTSTRRRSTATSPTTGCGFTAWSTTPVELDLAQLRARPHHAQITQHFCIQGWPRRQMGRRLDVDHLGLGQAPAEAKWVVFYSLGDGADKGIYYDAHPIEHMGRHLTMLAYDMNDQPLPSVTAPRCGSATRSSSASSRSSGSRASSSSPTSPRSGAARRLQQDHEFFGYRQSI